MIIYLYISYHSFNSDGFVGSLQSVVPDWLLLRRNKRHQKILLIYSLNVLLFIFIMHVTYRFSPLKNLSISKEYMSLFILKLELQKSAIYTFLSLKMQGKPTETALR